MSALVTASLCEEALLAAAPKDNCRINGEITGQFARNDRCRGSITGCELRRRFKLLLVQKRQRLESFLLHHASSLLSFVNISPSVPLFRSIVSQTTVVILPHVLRFSFPSTFSHFESLPLFFLRSRTFAKIEQNGTR